MLYFACAFGGFVAGVGALILLGHQLCKPKNQYDAFRDANPGYPPGQ